MKTNPLQFAVVREDPLVEIDLIAKHRIGRAVMIGSGGCTFFSIKSRFPDIDITLIEPNPAQIELIKEKITLLETASGDEVLAKFGVGSADSSSFIECGNFESLFRQFRGFINEFVAHSNEISMNFAKPEFWTKVFAHPYWATAFDLYFSESILRTTFGEAAIQHAPKNSYAPYFKRVLERGLLRRDADENYFLHHIFLGHYRREALPIYLDSTPVDLNVRFFNGFAQDFHDFTGRVLVHFSNIFDWCDEQTVRVIAASTTTLESGSLVVYRQLNNMKNYREHFGRDIRWHNTTDIVRNDRSLFYEKIEIGEKL